MGKWRLMFGAICLLGAGVFVFWGGETNKKSMDEEHSIVLDLSGEGKSPDEMGEYIKVQIMRAMEDLRIQEEILRFVAENELKGNSITLVNLFTLSGLNKTIDKMLTDEQQYRLEQQSRVEGDNPGNAGNNEEINQTLLLMVSVQRDRNAELVKSHCKVEEQFIDFILKSGEMQNADQDVRNNVIRLCGNIRNDLSTVSRIAEHCRKAYGVDEKLRKKSK